MTPAMGARALRRKAEERLRARPARPRVEATEEVLRLIQSFDPVGVAARDLQECLTLQVRHLGLEGTPAELKANPELMHRHLGV